MVSCFKFLVFFLFITCYHSSPPLLGVATIFTALANSLCLALCALIVASKLFCILSTFFSTFNTTISLLTVRRGGLGYLHWKWISLLGFDLQGPFTDFLKDEIFTYPVFCVLIEKSIFFAFFILITIFHICAFDILMKRSINLFFIYVWF